MGSFLTALLKGTQRLSLDPWELHSVQERCVQPITVLSKLLLLLDLSYHLPKGVKTRQNF